MNNLTTSTSATAAAVATIDTVVDNIAAGLVSTSNPNHLAVTADFTVAGWNEALAHETFVVTSLVRIRMWIIVTGNVDSLAHGATVAFGNETVPAAYIAATDETELDTGDLWYDATPTTAEDAYATVVFDRVVNGLDIGYTIAGEALTTGSMVVHCVWEPLVAGATVAAGAGGIF